MKLHFILSVGGTTGAIVTCPLEVVKTRLQSSDSGFPTCDGPSCDYVPIKSKKDDQKKSGKGKGGGAGGTSSGAVGNENGYKSALNSKPATGQELKYSTYQAVSLDSIAAEKRAGLVQTTIPVASRPAAIRSTNTNIASSLHETGVKSANSNSFVSYITSNGLSAEQNKSSYHHKRPYVNVSYRHRYFKPWDIVVRCSSSGINQAPPNPPKVMNVFQCLKFIYLTEGVFGLWKGLGPNLMGVAPSRAIYFWAYSTSKKNVNSMLPRKNRDSPFVHVVSAMSAGFSSSTFTNPIWLIKTRLQLDRATKKSKHRMTTAGCILKIYNEFVSIISRAQSTLEYQIISITVLYKIYLCFPKFFRAYLVFGRA